MLVPIHQSFIMNLGMCPSDPAPANQPTPKPAPAVPTPANQPTPEPAAPAKSSKKDTSGKIAGAVAGSLVGLAAVCAFVFFRPKGGDKGHDVEEMLIRPSEQEGSNGGNNGDDH